MVFNSPCFTVKSWLVQDQTVSGKDKSNLLIADSLLKTIWLSMHHVTAMKHWLVQSKRLLATAKVRRDNDQEQIQALVDKKKILINEESIRRDLKLEDAEGSTCLPNATIFEELARMGYEKPSQSAKITTWNEFSSTMAFAIICLANNQKFNFSKYILDNLVKNLEGVVKFLMFLSDPLLSGDDSFALNELTVFCISLQEQLLDLQNANAAQANEIATLKKKVKKLERKRRTKPTNFKRFKKVGIVRRKKSSTVKDSLGDQEDSFKQGRIIAALDADNEVTLEDDVDLMFDTSVLKGDEVVAEHGKEPEVVTTVSGPTTTTDELTLAQTLIEITKSKKVEAITTAATAATSVTTAIVTSSSKAKSIVFHDSEE
ncbi:hypothetical protein Tco_0140732 [Tanacetum coccineum]